MSDCVLVTGGAGFIGSHLVDALLEAGRKVRVLDDFSTGLRENLAGRDVEIVEGSLIDPEAVRRAVDGVRVVFHLGALASVARSVEAPLASHAACATGTLHLLDAARRLGVKRVVYAASSSAYGGLSTQKGQTEDDPVTTLSPYAAAKLAGEFYCQAFTATYQLETVRLRFFNIFGPRQRADSPYSGVIALFVAAMSQDRRPTVHGDGQQSRDFTYVANAVQALIRAAEAPSHVAGKVYNVGTGSSISVLQLVEALNALLGKRLAPIFVEPRPGDVRFSKADITRARQDLGYEPQVSFQDGLRKTLDWYQSRDARHEPV
jgi:UDP-glucose 4-epimerase